MGGRIDNLYGTSWRELQAALTDMFGQAPATGESQTGGGGQQNVPPPKDQSVAELLAKAQQSFTDADTALKQGDLATYATKEKQGRDYVDQARQRSAGSSSGSSSTTTTTTTTPGAA